MTPLRIGTRGSALALWQANYVADRLRAIVRDRPIVLVEIETAGDQVRDVPLTQIGGDGVFTKAIQQALVDDTVDVAVHSLKDLPTIPVDGIGLTAVPPRGLTGDAFLSPKYNSFASLPSGAIVATSSMRRKAMLLHRRPDLKIINIRGNVETRLRKMTEEGLDGLVLAQAGLERLGLKDHIREILDAEWMLPAVGQGALGLECRTADQETAKIVRGLDHTESHKAVLAERTLLSSLGGGCQIPLGALARVEQGRLHLHAAVLSQDGKKRIENRIDGSPNKAEDIARELASRLLAQGARELLAI